MNYSFCQVSLFFLLFIIGFHPLIAQQQRTCATMEYMHSKYTPPSGFQDNLDGTGTQIPNARNNKQRSSTTIFTIPTVIHIVHKNTLQNISDAQVLSQIQVLNEDFRRKNADTIYTASEFLPIAADTEIEFCLATLDPLGQPTTGITRTPTTRAFGINDTIKFTDMGGRDIWDASKYLNIWVGEIEGGILGYAQFPGANSNTDGVVIDYRYFGIMGTATAPFNLGRTATHEVGHWLNLFHIWGDGGCNLDDAVADTPIAGSPNYTNPPCTSLSPNSCIAATNDLPDMFQNYMDYSSDACMNLFTLGQKTRMRAMLEIGGPRASLLLSSTCFEEEDEKSADGEQEEDYADGKQEVNNADGEQEVNNADGEQEVNNADEEQEVNNADGEQEVNNADEEQEVNNADGEQEENNADEEQEVTQVIPTMSEWALLIFALLLLNIGAILICRLENLNECSSGILPE